MPEAMGSLFERYNPQGAMGGLFAPAYVPGYAPSEAAVMAWQAQQRPVSANMIDELRMPEAYQNPPGTNPDQPSQLNLTGNAYGEGRIPSRIKFGDPRGRVDPAVLRAAAMGGGLTPSVAERQAAIRQRQAENALAEEAYRQAYLQMIGGQAGGIQADLPRITG